MTGQNNLSLFVRPVCCGWRSWVCLSYSHNWECWITITLEMDFSLFRISTDEVKRFTFKYVVVTADSRDRCLSFIGVNEAEIETT